MTTLPDDEFASPSSVRGAVIDDKYRVERVIGRGGVGIVVAATHLEMAQRVAIKMIRDDVPMQRELLDRFHREARAAAMIRSEHVARVLDVGRLPTGRPYIVMEYLEGEDLEHVIARGPLAVPLAVDFVLQACEALAEAHRAGIIHRDLKPANLFLTRRSDGTPLIKLLDFGISKVQPLTAARTSRSFETTSIMGSPGYMAPEQMKSTRDVDARADVWSLGAVLYETVVGRPAFEGASMLEILNAIAACKPTRRPNAGRQCLGSSTPWSRGAYKRILPSVTPAWPSSPSPFSRLRLPPAPTWPSVPHASRASQCQPSRSRSSRRFGRSLARPPSPS